MSQLVAIASGKGGVGKTFLAASLAHALARRGRRVLLFDADLGLANLDVQLGIQAEHDLASVLGGRVALAQAVFHHAATGTDLIVGRSGSGLLAGLGEPQLERLTAALRRLCRRYAYAFLDLSAGLEGACRWFARAADQVLVITSDEPTALTDAYAFIKVACRERDAVQIVVNGVEEVARGIETYQALSEVCRRFLGRDFPLLGVVRRDRRVAAAIRSQLPFLARYPTSPAAADIERLARRFEETGRDAPVRRKSPAAAKASTTNPG